jgi:hypothetical protein
MKKPKPQAAGPKRPMPPAGMGEWDEDAKRWKPSYIPAPEVLSWVKSEILDEGGKLHNPEHKHLEFADVRFLWAGEAYEKQMRRIIGQTEEMIIRAGKWQKGRQEQQMVEWFGAMPEYLITLDANYCANCTDIEFCALVEHELYHIGQQKDEFGAPAFTRDGIPKLAMRGHDVEEFIGVVKRYGIGHPEGAIARLVKAANGAPEVGRLNIAQACGTCLLKAA